MKEIKRYRKPSGNYEAYLFEYEYNGARWAFEIHAASPEDAVRRVRTLSSQALILGKIMCVTPVGLGWLGALICRVRNWFR